MRQIVEGIYYFSRSSQSAEVNLQLENELVSLALDEETIITEQVSQLIFSSTIPGVPFEVVFPDGGKFIAKESSARLTGYCSGAEKLEKKKTLVISSIFLIPAFVWFFVVIAVPFIAEKSVFLWPQQVENAIGDQSFYVIEKAFLAPSELDKVEQEGVKTQWSRALSNLNLSTDKFKLHIYQSDYFSANAFALPNGIVVVTDDLVRLLRGKEDALLAVLLHEIAHVEFKHSLKLVTQSISNTVLISIFFGDMEGITEALLGTGSAILQNSFSRHMEAEADQYALEKLVQLDKPAAAFAEAMESLMDLQNRQGETNNQSDNAEVLQYLSTHPRIEERIKIAREYETLIN